MVYVLSECTAFEWSIQTRETFVEMQEVMLRRFVAVMACRQKFERMLYPA